jgi:hypothetical protein
MNRKAWLAGMLAACVAVTAGAAGGNPRKGGRSGKYLVPEPVTDTAAMSEWLLRLADRYRVDGGGTITIPPADQSVKRATTEDSRVGRGSSEEEDEEPEFVYFPVKGSGDCVTVGAGPGIQCIFNIHWDDQFEVNTDPDKGPIGVFNLPAGVSYLNPSMMLAGLDPLRKGLQLLLVDNKGLPEGGSATIAGDRATLRATCVNGPAMFLDMNPSKKYEKMPPTTCDRIMRIDAKPKGKVVHLSIDIEINRELVTQLQLTLRRDKNKDRR